MDVKKWIKVVKPVPDATLRLYCFPYAGGGASIYRPWPEAMPERVEVCAMQLPGREGRFVEPSYTKLDDLVADLVPVIQAHADRRFVFFGHSMGAITSFELARALRQQKAPCPVKLFLSGHRPPHWPKVDEDLSGLPDQQFTERLLKLDGTPKAVIENEELMELYRPILRADFELCETYSYAALEPLSCPISVYGGTRDHRAPPETMGEWQNHTKGAFENHTFEGGHFFIHSKQDEFLEKFKRDIAPLAALAY